MLSERVLRRIESLLDEADQAVANADWSTVCQKAQTVLDLDPENGDARTFLAAASKNALVERALERELDTVRRSNRKTAWEMASRDPLFVRDIQALWR
jgi:hypothetical protein